MMEQEEPVSEDHTALNRWSTKEIDSVIEEGHAKSLLLLLSSRTLSARKEALTNLAKLSHKLKESTYPEKDQIWILLSELAETARPHIATAPLPNTITAFAAQALSVLQDPLHCLYEKLNGFLQMGPTWALDKIPLMQRILSTAPNIDDAYYLELDWLVTYLLAALRTEADLKIFYQRRVFETLQTLYDNPYLARGLREKITRVFYRATTIDGGSDTLITRFGIISWLQEPIRSKGEAREGVAMRLLLERILETCDNDRLKGWTARTAEEILAESVAV
jgi:nucleolar pre-ribosomal-associated protein 1